MRRLDDIMDRMRGLVTYELDDGRLLRVPEDELRKEGLAVILTRYGIALPTGRVDVYQGDRRIGTVSAWFDPMEVKSTSYFYDPRPGDFKRSERGWEAAPQLGPGDLDAIPEFTWGFSQYEEGRAKRLEEDHQLLRDAVFGKDNGKGV